MGSRPVREAGRERGGSPKAETFDAIVVGGGPAGATAATLIAKAQHKVLLLEEARFPRHQIGESLLPWTVHMIAPLLGIAPALAKAKFTKKRGGVFRWGKNLAPWTFDFGDVPLWKGRAYSYQVRRAEFDQILLDNAKKHGVDVREKHAVSGIIRDRHGRCAGVRYTNDGSNEEHVARSRYVVDASGHGSRIAVEVGKRSYFEDFRNLALYGYYDGGLRLEKPHAGSILCQAFEDGWFWYIPLSPTLTSVGCVVTKKHLAAVKRDPERAMNTFLARCPIVRELLEPATRHRGDMYGEFRIRRDWSYAAPQFWAPGLVLVGDAACFVDPVFSTGVHLATFSGLLAARSINTVLAGRMSEKSCFDEFEVQYRWEFASIYTFLTAFYNQDLPEEGYFWAAKRILDTKEDTAKAFVRLVSGGASTARSAARELQTLGVLRVEALKRMNEGTTDAARAASVGEQQAIAGRLKRYIRHGRLVPSRNQLYWRKSPRHIGR